MRDLFYIMNEDGSFYSVDGTVFGAWFENASKNRIVDQTNLSNLENYPGGDMVSTVFLGIDHNHSSVGNPILFETMIFGGKYSDGQWRYETFADAKKGHWQIVDCLRAGCEPQIFVAPTSMWEINLENLLEGKNV